VAFYLTSPFPALGMCLYIRGRLVLFVTKPRHPSIAQWQLMVFLMVLPVASLPIMVHRHCYRPLYREQFSAAPHGRLCLGSLGPSPFGASLFFCPSVNGHLLAAMASNEFAGFWGCGYLLYYLRACFFSFVVNFLVHSIPYRTSQELSSCVAYCLPDKYLYQSLRR